MNKALERPLSWHQNKFDAMREQEVECYLLYRIEDKDEYIHRFPYTKRGKMAALDLAKRLGRDQDQVIRDRTQLKNLLPSQICSSLEYEKWCKEWGVVNS